MQWTVRLSETALKTLEKINKPEQNLMGCRCITTVMHLFAEFSFTPEKVLSNS